MNVSPAEVLHWRKSSRSNDQSLGCCVEVAADGRSRAVRDSKDPYGPRLSLSVPQWRTLVADIKNEAYEL